MISEEWSVIRLATDHCLLTTISMKGIILSGGAGTRLMPLTKVTSKQLLPVYDKPMIMYPLQILLNAGIKDILIIVAPDHAGDYLKLLGSGKEFGARFAYEIQDKPEGLAQAIMIGENFIEDENVCLILGDNILEDDISDSVKNFSSGAKIFVKEVPPEDRTRLGIVEFDPDFKVVGIEEKPQKPKSSYAQTGVYLYDKQVTQAVKGQKPSARGELEITDLNNWYLAHGQLQAEILKGEWIDAGTFESLFKASELARKKSLQK